MEELKGSCHMCGKCCEAIHLLQSPQEVASIAESEKMSGDARFITDNWTPITKEEAFTINPYLKQNEDGLAEKGIDNVYGKFYYYTCTQLDKETRKCRVHENRPQVCSGYPWYGRRPNNSILWYADECGYKVDLETSDDVPGMRKVPLKEILGEYPYEKEEGTK